MFARVKTHDYGIKRWPVRNSVNTTTMQLTLVNGKPTN